MTEKSKKNQLENLIENTLSSTPFEVVLVDYAKAGGDWKLSVYIDHPEGITLEHCQSVTNMILDRLEEEDPVHTSYHIEVSSPGVDRPLVKKADYERFLNSRIFVKTHQAVDGIKKITGELVVCDDEAIEVCNEHDGKTYRVPFDQIAKATLKPILNFN